MVASAQIPHGAIILNDIPAFHVPEDVNIEFLQSLPSNINPLAEELCQKRIEFLAAVLEVQFASLPRTKQNEVMSLADIFSSEEKTPAGIFCTNSMLGGGPRGMDSMLYPLIARLNSSCRPNAALVFKENREVTVQALCIIEEGEEICHYYGANTLLPTAERQQALLAKWKFTCTCNACTDAKSDQRRGRIFQINQDLLAGNYADNTEAYAMAKSKIKLHKEEQVFWHGYFQSIHHCIQFSAAAGEPLRETQKWAWKAANWARTFYPDDKELFEQYDGFVRDPSSVLKAFI